MWDPDTGRKVFPPFRRPKTIREALAQNYAWIMRASVAQEDGAASFGPDHHRLMGKFYHDILHGRKRIASFYNDERAKLTEPRVCAYCGGADGLSLDHVIPRLRRGPDAAENLVPACRSCNSSKGGRDLLAWLAAKSRYPSRALCRRYVKLAWRWCEEHGCLDRSLADDLDDLPICLPAMEQIHWPRGPAWT